MAEPCPLSIDALSRCALCELAQHASSYDLPSRKLVLGHPTHVKSLAQA